MDLIKFNGNDYPKLQSEGFASKYAFEFAKVFCTGIGVDVGYGKLEWRYINASFGVDDGRYFHDDGIKCKEFNNSEVNAVNFHPSWTELGFIHSSHFLEHYNGRYQYVIEYWLSKLKNGGIIFMYLPNCDYQDYWAFGNTKHIHHLTPSLLNSFCSYLLNYKLISNFVVTDGFDLNGSFYCIIEK